MSRSASRTMAGRTGCQDMPALQAVILPAAEHSNATECSTTQHCITSLVCHV